MIKTICVPCILAVAVLLASCGGTHTIGAANGTGNGGAAAQFSGQQFMAGFSL